MKLEGSLEKFPLRELIEMTFYSSVTGVITVYGAKGSGQIFFRDGMPVHADYGAWTGMDAVAAIFEETKAKFSFVSDTTCEEESLWGDPLDMADQAERLAQRWLRVRPYVPNLSLAPRHLKPLEQARFEINPAHLTLFNAIDGQRTLQELAQSLNYETIDLCEAIVQLCVDNLVELRRTNPIIAKEDSPPLAVPLPPRGGGLLDRLLNNLTTVAPPSAHPPSTGANAAAPAASPTPRPREEEAILRLLRG